MAERGNAFALAVCAALGLDPGTVRRVSVRADAKDLLRVTVAFAPTTEAAEQIRLAVPRLADDPKVVSLLTLKPSLDATTIISEAEEWVD